MFLRATSVLLLFIIHSVSVASPLGLEKEGATYYLGIEFAEAKRWERAELLSFDENASYSSFGARCPQRLGNDGAIQGEERCLFLNIAVPNQVTADAPVLVWFHGGGFTGGSGNDWVDRSKRFTDSGIIFISPNYRLGLLGNIDSPEFSGGFSLTDMQAALRWTQRNIGVLGGNLNNVTIGGESAGGMAVQMLLASPDSQGLFARAISQSGYGTWPMAKLGELASTEVIGYLGGTPQANMPAEQLVNAVTGFLVPYYGDEFLPLTPAAAFKEGKQQLVPLVIGANSYDGSVFPAAGLTPESVFALLGEAAMPIFQRYLEDFGSQEIAFTMMFGELRYALSGWEMAESHANTNLPTYHYYFDYLPIVLQSNLPGAPHGIELPLLMDYDGGWPKPDGGDPIGNELSEAWIKFIIAGELPDVGRQFELTERTIGLHHIGDLNEVAKHAERMRMLRSALNRN
ncbi:carboxylesterase family protein [Umboniibacter marinipuniceus]|uniref:Para-nitrobenzyl esterase n=1 Tax=Umboniibacter marinipuniceus TaxID=569599 RepID=A0A3L9ZYS2_9GAMM|nr:carboxylesterase family protein [Umboniibacter marinipuniceus]RMA77600.1 para-nitrobenzyl esterase [Umboniibacter marinipuniceus]